MHYSKLEHHESDNPEMLLITDMGVRYIIKIGVCFFIKW